MPTLATTMPSRRWGTRLLFSIGDEVRAFVRMPTLATIKLSRRWGTRPISPVEMRKVGVGDDESLWVRRLGEFLKGSIGKQLGWDEGWAGYSQDGASRGLAQACDKAKRYRSAGQRCLRRLRRCSPRSLWARDGEFRPRKEGSGAIRAKILRTICERTMMFR